MTDRLDTIPTYPLDLLDEHAAAWSACAQGVMDIALVTSFF